MKINNLKLNRFLNKNASQDDETKSAAFTVTNPVPKRGLENLGKNYASKGNEDNEGARDILTGTVITSCFIQTTALPSRVEMEGNNVTFYDDTFEEGGVVKGDTSRLIFTHDLNSDEGFIMEKRSSIHDTYDNVLSLYATPAREGRVNYLFIGRAGVSEVPTRKLSYLEMTANIDTTLPFDAAKGAYNGQAGLRMSTDGVPDDNAGIYLVNAGAVADGRTGIVANLFGSGDGSGNDDGAAQMTYFENGVSTFAITISKNGIQMFGLPTSSAGLAAGTLWKDGTTLRIV